MIGADRAERVKELIRLGAQMLLDAPPDWFAEVDAAAFSAPDMQPVADDPELRAFAVRATHAIVTHWAQANVRNPGMPVAPNTEEPFEAVRLFTYRGYHEASLDAYRLGQNAAWRRWMRVAFELTSDAEELHELLDVSAASISDFVNATIAATVAQLKKEREQLARGGDSARRELVALLLNGTPVGRESAEQTLGYRLAQRHTAAVVWTTESAPRLTELEQVADSLARHTRAREWLRIVASPGTVWMWLAEADTVHLRDAAREIGASAGLRVAIGSTGRGIDGFRVAHLDAISTQQTMARLDTDHPVGTFAEVEGVLLLTSDPDRANRFIANAWVCWKAPTRRYAKPSERICRSTATPLVPPKGCSRTATPSCGASNVLMNSCHARCTRTASTSRWRWKSCTGAAEQHPPRPRTDLSQKSK